MLLLGILFLAVWLVLFRRASFSEKKLVWCGVLCVLCCLGYGRMTLELKERPVETYLHKQESERTQKPGSEISWTAQGRLTSYSQKQDFYTLTLSDVTLIAQDGKLDAPVFQEKKILVSVKQALLKEQDLLCGRQMEVSGRAEQMKCARNPGGFSAWLSYRGKKISLKLRAEEISWTEEEIRPADAWADRFRSWGQEALAGICEEEDLGIFQSILLGDKSELSEETEALFQKNGIAHILAVSGLHVSLIGMSLYHALRFAGLGYGIAGSIASLLLLFYGTVTGFGPSVFRAVLMAAAGFLARYLGRSYDLLSALALALLVPAADSPLLLCSGGLQLSYLAVFAVGIWQEQRGKEKAETGFCGRLLESLSLSLAIQLLTLPAILFHFYTFPPWGILLNLLVIPLLSYAAASGILGLVFSFLAGLFPIGTEGLLLAARAFMGPGHYIFWLYREWCGWAEKLPFSSIAVGQPDFWKIVLYYSLLFFWYRNRKQVLLLSAALFCLCVRPIHGLHVWFLDVGQGDAVLLRTKEDTILSDCGSSQEKQVGKWTLVPFLKSQGIRSLDYVLVSHSDADHVNGILWMLEEEEDISVGMLVLPAAGKGDADYQELLDAAGKRRIPVAYMGAGDRLETGMPLAITCLYPEYLEGEKSGQGLDANAQSLVLEVRYQNFSLLLTGDISANEERKLLPVLSARNRKMRTGMTVLKAAHHGSAGSSSAEFLEVVSPELTVLSYGQGNSYGHPAPEAVMRLEKNGTELWETAKTGAIHLVTDGTKWQVFAGFFWNSELQKE